MLFDLARRAHQHGIHVSVLLDQAGDAASVAVVAGLTNVDGADAAGVFLGQLEVEVSVFGGRVAQHDEGEVGEGLEDEKRRGIAG